MATRTHTYITHNASSVADVRRPIVFVKHARTGARPRKIASDSVVHIAISSDIVLLNANAVIGGPSIDLIVQM